MLDLEQAIHRVKTDNNCGELERRICAMKFVLHFPSTASSTVLSAKQFSDQDFGVSTPSPFEAKLGRVTAISNTAPIRNTGKNETDLLIWDGAFISDTHAFSHLLHDRHAREAATEIDRYLDGVAAGQAPDHLSGIFGAARIALDGSFIVAPDPLSQYAFFRLERDGHTLISNSLHLIEKACALLGIVCSRDFTSNAFEAAFGVGGWTKTGLEGVDKLPLGYGVVSDGTRVTIRRFSRPWNGDTSYYQDKIRAAAAGLVKRAQSLSKTLPNKGLVIDLSGGKDTRVVLGSFLGAGAKNFKVFTGGPATGPDRATANRLINQLGLQRASFLSNVGADENIDPTRAMARAAYRSMGSSNLYHTALGTEQLHGVAQVRGGCAEARTKSFFTNQGSQKQRRMLAYHQKVSGVSWWRQRWGRFAGMSEPGLHQEFAAQLLSRGKPSHRFFTDEFLLSAASAFSDQIMWLKEQGVEECGLMDAHYVADRGWRHGGFTVQVTNDSRPTFEPLNDIRLMAAQNALQTQDKEQARLAFDLLCQFGESSLVEMPFAETSWPMQWLSNAQKNRRAELSGAPSTPADAEALTPRRGTIQGIHNLGRTSYMKHVQAHFHQLAGDTDISSSIWQFLDRENLLQTIKSDGFATDRYAMVGSRLYYGFVWMSKQEERAILD